MSEENHSIEGGEEQIAEDVKNLLKQGKKTITVKHIFEDKRSAQPPTTVDDDAEGGDGSELGETKRKLQEREAQLAALALKDFNSQKLAVLSLISENKREQAEKFIGDDPDKLEFLKYQTGFTTGDDDSGVEAVPPKGKAGKQKTGGTQQPSGILPRVSYDKPLLNDLSKLYEMIEADPSQAKDAAEARQIIKEKEAAEAAINQLLDEAQKGVQNRPKGSNYMLPSGVVMNCPACGGIVEFDMDKTKQPCPYCGHVVGGIKLRPYKGPV